MNQSIQPNIGEYEMTASKALVLTDEQYNAMMDPSLLRQPTSETNLTSDQLKIVSSIVHQVNDDENAAAELAASKYIDELNQKAATNNEYGEAVQNIINAGHTKSAKIRALLALNLKRGEVAKLLGICYQHVRNVEMMPIKKAA